jgi:hypothetical protein
VGGRGSQSGDKTKDIQPVVAIVTVDDLLTEYEANEVRADDKYKDQWIKIIGICARVGKDENGRPYVLLQGEKKVKHAQFTGVTCYFQDGYDLGSVNANSVCTFHGEVDPILWTTNRAF